MFWYRWVLLLDLILHYYYTVSITKDLISWKYSCRIKSFITLTEDGGIALRLALQTHHIFGRLLFAHNIFIQAPERVTIQGTVNREVAW